MTELISYHKEPAVDFRHVKSLSLLLFLSCAPMAPVFAAGNTSTPATGVVILTSATGQNPVTLPFTTLKVDQFDSFQLTAPDGSVSTIDNRAVGKIVYFYQTYYSELHSDPIFMTYEKNISQREMLVPVEFPQIITQDDFNLITSSYNSLKKLSANYQSSATALEPFVHNLGDDLDRYANQNVFVNGNWISRQQFNAHGANASLGASSQYISFTTLDGKRY